MILYFVRMIVEQREPSHIISFITGKRDMGTYIHCKEISSRHYYEYLLNPLIK